MSIGWPYDEFKVELEITDRSEHILAGSAAIHDSEGGIIDTIIISDVGNYSTNWLPATSEITIIIFNQGWGWAFIEGEIWVWARYSYLRFWYGDN
ncbi:MAG: hypothetical protein ACXADB_13430 [Candidatus Hermodarchaeia archaeon]